MAHKSVPFLHERAKASLDSCIMDKWDVDLAAFVDTMEQHKQMPPKEYHVVVQQYDDTLSTNASANAGAVAAASMGGKKPTGEAVSIAPATSATKIFCSPDMLISDFKRLYYDERIKARKRLAKEVFYRRIERESGPKKLAMVKEQEEEDKRALGDEYVDPLTIVLPEEYDQCSYEWGFLTVAEFEEAEIRREQKSRAGKFVPSRVAVTNLRFGGHYMKDYHTLRHYGVITGGHVMHTRRFPASDAEP
jgi:hypothetical protein